MRNLVTWRDLEMKKVLSWIDVVQFVAYHIEIEHATWYMVIQSQHKNGVSVKKSMDLSRTIS